VNLNSIALILQFLYTMASEIVVGYLFDNSEDVDVEVERSLCCSIVGGVESTSLSLSSQ
jgi:hypothetical protein